MKSQSLNLFAIAFVFGLVTIFASAPAANAQSKLSFEFPFEFHVGKEKLAAGKYEMVKIKYGRYLLRNAATKSSSLVIFENSTGDINKSETETVVFNRYGDTYFLSSLYDRRGDVGKAMLESKYEKQIRAETRENENQLAGKRKKPEQVSVNVTR